MKAKTLIWFLALILLALPFVFAYTGCGGQTYTNQVNVTSCSGDINLTQDDTVYSLQNNITCSVSSVVDDAIIVTNGTSHVCFDGNDYTITKTGAYMGTEYLIQFTEVGSTSRYNNFSFMNTNLVLGNYNAIIYGSSSSSVPRFCGRTALANLTASKSASARTFFRFLLPASSCTGFDAFDGYIENNTVTGLSSFFLESDGLSSAQPWKIRYNSFNLSIANSDFVHYCDYILFDHNTVIITDANSRSLFQSGGDVNYFVINNTNITVASAELMFVFRPYSEDLDIEIDRVNIYSDGNISNKTFGGTSNCLIDYDNIFLNWTVDAGCTDGNSDGECDENPITYTNTNGNNATITTQWYCESGWITGCGAVQNCSIDMTSQADISAELDCEGEDLTFTGDASGRILNITARVFNMASVLYNFTNGGVVWKSGGYYELS